MTVLYFECMHPYTFRTIIEADEKGAYHGFVPALKGCHTWGKTLAETKKNLQEAIGLYVESLLAHGETVPKEESFESFETVFIMKPKSRVRASRLRQYA